MTTEENLLLKDLCARLPYGVNVNYFTEEIIGDRLVGIHNIGDLRAVYVFGNSVYLEVTGHHVQFKQDSPYHTPKPYLRPMSSMTEEEREDYKAHMEREQIVNVSFYYVTYKGIDWLNEHHFDYRGLIEKGLALEAPEGMYKTK